MGRYGRRISRGLIGALILTLVLGLTFYLKNLSSTQAAEEPAAPVRPVPLPIVTAPQPAQPAPVEELALVQQPPATPPPPPSNPLVQAQTKQQAGDLLAARKLFNDALLSGNLSAADATQAKKAMADINKVVIFSPKPFPEDQFGGTYSVKPGEVLQKIAEKYEVPWEALLRLNGMTDARRLRAGQTLKVIRGPFNAIATKSTFTLDVYLGPPGEKGSLYITSFPVGLGKDDSTPTGTWLVAPGTKLKNPTYFSPRGEGVIEADDPKNPLGERWIGLTGIEGHAVGKPSYGIHGTIDESSIGKQDSMGCIRLINTDVEWLYDLLVEGKSIVIVKE